jgi:hypothetical protein
MRRLVPLMCLLAVLALSASPASALTKEQQIVSVNRTANDRELCPFRISIHDQGSFKTQLFFGPDGHLVKRIDSPHGPFEETYTAKGTTLRTTDVSYTFKVATNPDGSVKTFTISGIFFHVVVPGIGPVLSTVGHFVFDADGNLIKSGGRSQSIDGDTGAFCAAFGN